MPKSASATTAPASNSGLPWFVADLVAPAALAGGLTLLRVDGRTFHQAAWALVSFWAAPRRTVALSVPLAGSPTVAAARPGVRPRWLGRVPEALPVPRAWSRARADRARHGARDRPPRDGDAPRRGCCSASRCDSCGAGASSRSRARPRSGSRASTPTSGGESTDHVHLRQLRLRGRRRRCVGGVRDHARVVCVARPPGQAGADACDRRRAGGGGSGRAAPACRPPVGGRSLRERPRQRRGARGRARPLSRRSTLGPARAAGARPRPLHPRQPAGAGPRPREPPLAPGVAAGWRCLVAGEASCVRARPAYAHCRRARALPRQG